MNPDCPAQVWVFLACALFFLGLYNEAEEAASKGRLSSWVTCVNSSFALFDEVLIHVLHFCFGNSPLGPIYTVGLQAFVSVLFNIKFSKYKQHMVCIKYVMKHIFCLITCSAVQTVMWLLRARLWGQMSLESLTWFFCLTIFGVSCSLQHQCPPCKTDYSSTWLTRLYCTISIIRVNYFVVWCLCFSISPRF